MEPGPRPIFISHATPDEPWARWIAATLDAAGLPTELAVRDWPAGCDFSSAMDRAMKACRATLVVLTPHFDAARYTQPELANALRQDPEGRGGTLLPVRVEPVDLAGMLAGRVWIDLVGVPEAEAAAELVLRVRHALDGGRLERPSPFPGGSRGAAAGDPRGGPRGTVASGDTAAPFPGALPPLWTIPVPAQGFVGREAELARLDAAGAGVLALTQALTGLGGVGKTTLARQWGWSRGRVVSLGWWVRAESPAQAEDDLLGLAWALGLAEPGGDRARALTALHTWLHTPRATPTVPHPERPWLLVFDNAGDPAGLSLPAGPGVVLVTSRDRRWERRGPALKVETLPPAACRTLLLDGRDGPGNTEADADALAAALGHLPLALSQAQAWCHETGASLARCRQRLAEGSAVLGFAPGTGEATVAGTWTLLREGLPEPSRLLLELLSCFGPEEIPVEAIFAAAPDGVEEVVAALCGPGLDEALAPLHRMCLAERRGPVVQVHRLVQRVTREALAPAVLTEREAAARRLLRGAMPHPQDLAGWHIWRLLGPHAEVLGAGEGVEGAGLLGELAFFLRTQADHRRALELERRALRITEAALGPEHPDVGLRLGNLASTLGALGQHAEARPLKERALRITEAALGPEHPDVGKCLNNVAETLSALGLDAEARPLRERALRIIEAALGPEHRDVGICLGNLAGTLSALALDAEALPLEERALRITEAALGPEHPEVGTRLRSLAATLSALGQHADARPLEERALRISEAALGPEHPAVGTSLGNLASTLSALGQHAEARPLQERALRVTEAALGPEHPDVGLCLGNLAATLSALGLDVEARPLEERALRITEAVLGPEHPDVGICLGNLAETLSALGQHVEARPLKERALRITEAVLGAEHPRVGIRLGNLALTEWKLGDRDSARTRMRRAVAVFTKSLGADHPHTRHYAAQLRQMEG